MDVKTPLQELLEAVGPAPVENTNSDGKLWAARFKRADTYHDRESYDWEDLRKLHSEHYKPVRIFDPVTETDITVQVKNSMMKAVFRNRNVDIYHRNPDPWIQSRKITDPEMTRQKDRMVRDLSKTIHAACGTERIVKKCLDVEPYLGMGIVWTQLITESHDEPVAIEDEMTGEVIMDPETEEALPELAADTPEGEATPASRTVIDQQYVMHQFVSPHDMRWDPDGRRWDTLEDFKFIFRIYKRTIKEIWEDEKIPIDDRKVIIHSAINNERELRMQDGGLEGDPAFIPVILIEAWSRPDKTIYHFVKGQEYVFDSYPWPKAIAEAEYGRGRFPCRVIYLNEPDVDRDDAKGYPIPSGREIRAQIEDLNHLRELFLQSALNAIDKHFSIEGLLDEAAYSTVANGHKKGIIFLKKDALRDVFGPDLGGVDIRKILASLPVSKDQMEAMNYAAMMDRMENEIYQTVGQGPGDRGGVASADTATESANIRAQLDKRSFSMSELVSDAYDDITELDFLWLISDQELPIHYQKSTGAFSDPVWDEFVISELEGHDLHFSHRVGTARPLNRQQVKAERRELFGIVAPHIQNAILNRNQKKLLALTLEPYDMPEIEAIVEDEAPDIAAQILQIKMQIRQGQIQPSPAVAAQLEELESALYEAVLGPQGIEQVALGVGGNAQQPGQASTGRSEGEVRSAEAAASQVAIQ